MNEGQRSDYRMRRAPRPAAARQHPHPRTRDLVDVTARPTLTDSHVVSKPPAGGVQPYNPTDQATTAWFRKYHKYLFILLSLLVLLIVGSTYAAINLTAQNPPEHSALTPGINLAQGEKGLIGWWKLNGNLTDSTPYADNGTNYGATAAADRKGQANGAMAFDGSSDYATIPNSPALQNTPANQWTMSAWVYPTSATGTHDILRKGGSGSGYFLRLTGGSTLQSLFSWGGSSNYAQESGGTVPTNQWSLVTATYDGITIRHYVNGVLAGSWVQNKTLSFDNSVICLGSNNCFSSVTELYQGSIADARLYNRALSQSDITNLYNSYNSQVNLYSPPGSGGSVNLAAGLVGYWPFNGNAKDATPYSNNGIVSGATLTTGRDGQANSAYSFDGTSNDTIQMNGPVVSTDATIAGWFKYTNAASTTALFRDSTCSAGWLLYGNGTNFSFRAGGGQFNTSVATSAHVNQWTHFAITKSGSNVALYVNGSSVYTGSGATNTAAVMPWHLMANGTCGAYVPGSIDDFRIYNRALSAAEIQALYNLPD